MNADDLKKFIDNLPFVKIYFKGVFSINTLPKKLTAPSFLICNFDNDSDPGSHWFCLFKHSKLTLECFDSLGLTNLKLQKVQQHCKISNVSYFSFNETQVQSNFTSTCGKFVLYFAIQRLHNLDLSFFELMNEIFESNVNKNELNVTNFLQDIQNEQSN